MTKKEIMASGRVLVDEPHTDGGLGFLVAALPDGALAFRARGEGGEVFFVVGQRGAERLSTALASWDSMEALRLAPKPEEAPNDE